MAESKRIAIVAEGEYGDLSRTTGDYRRFEERLQTYLKAMGHDVRIADSTNRALAELNNSGVIVFTTIGMLRTAERVVRQCPQLRVVVVSGHPLGGLALGGPPPDERVIITSKMWTDRGVRQMLSDIVGK